MRNKPLITIIILTAIGIFIGFNFQTPGMKQYNQLNKKGNELLRDIRGGKHDR